MKQGETKLTFSMRCNTIPRSAKNAKNCRNFGSGIFSVGIHHSDLKGKTNPQILPLLERTKDQGQKVKG